MESILAAISTLAILGGVTTWIFAWRINNEWAEYAKRMNDDWADFYRAICEENKQKSEGKKGGDDMKGDIAKRVRRVVARQLEMNVDDVEMDSELIELGADSLDVIEILDAVAAEFDIYISDEDFDIYIPDEDLERIKTVNDIVDCVKLVISLTV